jgi:short-subunit dehydrogenase
VVIGGGSELASAVLKRLAPRGLAAVVLAGPHAATLERTGDELRSLGVGAVTTIEFDVRETDRHGAFVDEVVEILDRIDLAVVAVGALGNLDVGALSVEEVARGVATNFAGPAAIVTAVSQRMRAQGTGRIVVFSSVAGVRVRASNLVYGAAKAGLDSFCQGLADALHGSGVEVLIVRPGFVYTKMTAGRSAVPLAIGPDVVADAVVRGLDHGRAVIYVPGILRFVFAVFKLLPRVAWRQISRDT